MLSLPGIPAFTPGNWNEVDVAFASAPVIDFAQHWLDVRSPDFAPAQVRIGWNATSLCFDAHLTDHAIFTAATRRNQELYRLGDTLEFFAGADDLPSYIEYHYSPNNLTMQLAWPQPIREIDLTAAGGVPGFMVVDDASHHAVLATPTGWRVCASVPARAFGLEVASLADTTWDLSFSRYDYASAETPPILSSTSPHAEASFHRRHEWLRVLCCDCDPKVEAASATSNDHG